MIEELRRDPEFGPCIQKSRTGNTGLLQAFTAISQDLGVRFVFIMDEWDLIYREYRSDPALQLRYISLLADLFKSSAGLSCFSLVYLTGILLIKKYNSQSALNNFDEFNMLSPGNFAPYFGFTGEDVTGICNSVPCHLPISLLKEWYEGYRINYFDTAEKQQISMEIYNPNSVCLAVRRNECACFWNGTSSNEEEVRLVNMNFAGIRDDILSLIAGGRVQFDCGSFRMIW